MYSPILKVNNLEYPDWDTIHIHKSMLKLAGSFAFGGLNSNQGDASRWGFYMGDAAIVNINDQDVIKGYIDNIETDDSASDSFIEINGRDNTSDLVDCTYNETDKEFKKLTIVDILTRLCRPFNITVLVDASAESLSNQKIDSFQANEGEFISIIINRLCTTHGIVPFTTGDSYLTITSLTQDKSTDILADNILNSKAKYVDYDRFSDYSVKGYGLGNDEKDMSSYIHPNGSVTDEIMRKRTLTTFSDVATTDRKCVDMAKFEARKRAGLSRTYNYTLENWTQSDGRLWNINNLVDVKDTKNEIESEMLIYEIDFYLRQGEDMGTYSVIKVCHPDTFNINGKDPKQIIGAFDARSAV